MFHAANRNPRSALVITRDPTTLTETLFFITAHGRVDNTDGMTLPEFSQHIMDTIPHIYMAINLDGGASSRITIKEEPTQNIMYIPSSIHMKPYHVGSILSFVKMDDRVPDTFSNIPAGPMKHFKGKKTRRNRYRKRTSKK